MQGENTKNRSFRQYLTDTGKLKQISREISADRARHSETQFKILFVIFCVAGILFPLMFIIIVFADQILAYLGLTKTVINWILSG